MKTVNISELSRVKMTAGNEKKYPIVIHKGVIKEWVGIGWIRLREAEKEDFENYPVVISK